MAEWIITVSLFCSIGSILTNGDSRQHANIQYYCSTSLNVCYYEHLQWHVNCVFVLLKGWRGGMQGRGEEKKGHGEKRRTTVLFTIWSGLHKRGLVSDSLSITVFTLKYSWLLWQHWRYDTQMANKAKDRGPMKETGECGKLSLSVRLNLTMFLLPVHQMINPDPALAGFMACTQECAHWGNVSLHSKRFMRLDALPLLLNGKNFKKL